MKIGIVTVQYASNFGSFLQAYTLKTALEDMGNDVYFIKNCSDKYERGLFYRIRPYGKEYFHLPSFIIKNMKGWQMRNAFLKAQKEFRVVNYTEELDLDLVILGSDEIWNVRNPLFRNPIFFGKGMKNVMSYAVSIGNATVEDMSRIPLSYYDNITPILVRDTMTQQYLDLVGVKSELVCDPTLLVNSSVYSFTYFNKAMENPYLLVYSYGYEISDAGIKSLQQFAKNKGLKLLSVCFPLMWCDKTINCSPLEFCSVMKQAQYVFTSTFHGTIFAMINHKQFISLPQSIKTSDLLKELNLEERLIQKNELSIEKLEEMFLVPIDYQSVDSYIEGMRTHSYELLKMGIDKYNH